MELSSLDHQHDNTYLSISRVNCPEGDTTKSKYPWKVRLDCDGEDDCSEFSSIYAVPDGDGFSDDNGDAADDDDDGICSDCSVHQFLSMTLDDEDVDETSKRSDVCTIMLHDTEQNIYTWLQQVSASQKRAAPVTVGHLLHCHKVSMQRSPAISNIHTAELRQRMHYKPVHDTSRIHCTGVIQDTTAQSQSTSSMLTELVGDTHGQMCCDRMICGECDSQKLPLDSIIDRSFYISDECRLEHDVSTDSDSSFYMHCPLVTRGITRRKPTVIKENIITKKLRSLFQKH